MTGEKAGRVVWHDLFTNNRQRSMEFYQRVAGWTYKIEHATDFAWGGGEKDFVLALLDEEAGAGLAQTPPGLSHGWLAYVEVRDVDAAAALTEHLGGTIVRQPFDVPGVGRNALLRDPLGALIGISLSRHSFPAPQRQFGVEVYLSESTTFPVDFYLQLFDWDVRSIPDCDRVGGVMSTPSGEDVAVWLRGKTKTLSKAVWVPSLKVPDPKAVLRDLLALKNQSFSVQTAKSTYMHVSFLRDPDRVLYCLLEYRSKRQ
ncbi:MAG: VOC family protein [Devosia sp.]